MTGSKLLAALSGSLLFFALAQGAWAKSHTAKDPLYGLWQTEDRDAIVEIYGCEAKICGRFYWIRPGDKDTAPLDEHNPDPAARNRPLCHSQFIGDFDNKGKGHYENGWIYNPDDGSQYDAELTLDGHDRLTVRGFVLVPALGQSQTWTRVKSHATCSAQAS